MALAFFCGRVAVMRVRGGGGPEDGSALNEWGGRAQTAGGSKHSSEATQAGPAP